MADMTLDGSDADSESFGHRFVGHAVEKKLNHSDLSFSEPVRMNHAVGTRYCKDSTAQR